MAVDRKSLCILAETEPASFKCVLDEAKRQEYWVIVIWLEGIDNGLNLKDDETADFGSCIDLSKKQLQRDSMCSKYLTAKERNLSHFWLEMHTFVFTGVRVDLRILHGAVGEQIAEVLQLGRTKPFGLPNVD